MQRRHLLLLPLLLFTLGNGRCATTSGKTPDALAGRLLDPEGESIEFAKISVEPEAKDPEYRRRKNEELPPRSARGLAVSTESGRWVVDHLTDDASEQYPLPRRYYYAVTIYKAGYDLYKDEVLFDKGTLELDVTLYPDVIRVDDSGNMMDTSVDDTNTGTGALRQGQ